MAQWPPDYATDYTVQFLPVYGVHPVFGYFNNCLTDLHIVRSKVQIS